jgi:transposase-like protein
MPSGGQNSKFTPENRERVIESLTEGKTLSETASTVGISVSTLSQWRMKDADFDNSCSRAQSIGFEIQADSLLRIPEEIPDVQRARLKSENIRWLLARRAAHKYGDRLEVNLNQTVDIKLALAEARSRVPQCDLSIPIEAQVRLITGNSEPSTTDGESDEPIKPEENQTPDENPPDVFS